MSSLEHPRRRVSLPGPAAVLAAVVLGPLLLAACGTGPPSTAPSNSPSGSPSSTSASTSAATPGLPATGSTTPAASGSGREVRVRDAATLQAALAVAHPGTTITLADGTYRGDSVRGGHPEEPGRFVASSAGTAAAPITLRGSRRAVLDGGGPDGGYGLHLRGADYWRLEGFTVSSASKGIVLDGSSHVSITGVRVTDIGAEGVHFRSFSSANILSRSQVDHTGVSKPNFGEGVYVGSATSNWGTYSRGGPDTSDRNQIIDNQITATAAENIDVKEGSTGGILRGNTMDGSDLAGKNSADSWVDIKGNDYTVQGNRGAHTLLDGFQVHVQLDGWGRRNTFSANVLDVQAPGVGIWLQNTAVDQGNVIHCSNIVTGAAAGDYATNHYTLLDCVP